MQFTVNEQGAVSFARIVRSVNPELDGIAYQIISNMPKWESPGMQRGKPVEVSFTVPVSF